MFPPFFPLFWEYVMCSTCVQLRPPSWCIYKSMCSLWSLSDRRMCLVFIFVLFLFGYPCFLVTHVYLGFWVSEFRPVCLAMWSDLPTLIPACHLTSDFCLILEEYDWTVIHLVPWCAFGPRTPLAVFPNSIVTELVRRHSAPCIPLPTIYTVRLRKLI